MERLGLIELMESDAAGLSPEGRGLWEELELLAESAPELDSRMAREYEVSERIFDLPVSEQGILARLAQLLSGLREGDEAEVRASRGGAPRPRRHQRRQDRRPLRRPPGGSRHDPGESDSPARSGCLGPSIRASAGWRRAPMLTLGGHVQRVCAPGQDKMGGMDQNGRNR